MEIYYGIVGIIFLFGIMVGSFLNVVVYRMESEIQFWQGRSRCMTCEHVLEWFDLVPVLSFITLRAKCRYCGAPLSWQYPSVELATGLLAVVFFLVQIPSLSALAMASWVTWLELLLLWLVGSQLIVIFVYDVLYMLIPDTSLKIIQGSGLIWIILQTIQLGSLYTGLYTGLVCSLILFGMYFFSKKQAMGFGDIELILGLGWFIPFSMSFWFFFGAFFIGSVWGVTLMILQRIGTLKARMPFGPSIILAFILLWMLSPYWSSLQMLLGVVQ